MVALGKHSRFDSEALHMLTPWWSTCACTYGVAARWMLRAPCMRTAPGREGGLGGEASGSGGLGALGGDGGGLSGGGGGGGTASKQTDPHSRTILRLHLPHNVTQGGMACNVPCTTGFDACMGQMLGWRSVCSRGPCGCTLKVAGRHVKDALHTQHAYAMHHRQTQPSRQQGTP